MWWNIIICTSLNKHGWIVGSIIFISICNDWFWFLMLVVDKYWKKNDLNNLNEEQINSSW